MLSCWASLHNVGYPIWSRRSQALQEVDNVDGDGVIDGDGDSDDDDEDDQTTPGNDALPGLYVLLDRGPPTSADLLSTFYFIQMMTITMVMMKLGKLQWQPWWWWQWEII